MESDLSSPAGPPVCLAPGGLADTLCPSVECVSQTPAASADPLDSFSLIEPPPLDWRSDSSSDAGAVEDLDEATFPSSLGAQGVKTEVGAVGVELGPLVQLAPASEAEVNGRPATEEVIEEEGLKEVGGKEEDVARPVADRTPSDEDHTHIHALLNRLQRMGEEVPATSTSDLDPYAHPQPPADTRPQGPPGAAVGPPTTETTGLLFSESHQRDLLGLLECTEIAATPPPPQHQHHHHHHCSSSDSSPRGDVDAVVSVSYSQDEAQEFWRHYRNDWRLPRKESSYASSLPDNQPSEPVWRKREPEVEEEEEGGDEEVRRGRDSEDYRPAYKDVPGPCDPEDLIDGIIFGAKYLGSTQIRSDKNLSTNARMTQAQEAVDRIKAPEGESQPMVEVDLFISTQRIKVLNADTQEAMMDHSLQMISYIADINNIVVLMARRKPPSPKASAADGTPSSPSSSSSSSGPVKKCSMVCHVFSSEDAKTIAQAIGQAFGVAYQQFLQANGIEASQMKPGDYSDFLGAQELYNGDLAHFSDSQNIRDVLISKGPGEILGLAMVESGWGSILPTVVVANLLHGGPAERSGALSIGDRIMSVNGTSLVGLPIASCQNVIRDLKNQTIVKLSIVHCPPVTMAIIKRPDPKYQLGFSVEDGIICSLMRGGIAERGGIRVGHRIIEINGQSVVATPHEKIISILTNAVGEIHLKTMPASTYRLLTGQEQPLFL
uniref:Amyloid beta precursor protein binding family A member 3 n=1 Tax=Gadus morhua TaxID=8049 RepID=A0A8C5BG40_GADMO